MSVELVVNESGGIATRSALLALFDRKTIDDALDRGLIVADSRGCYALPSADEAVRVAHAFHGVLCLESAALHHGWDGSLRPAPPPP